MKEKKINWWIVGLASAAGAGLFVLGIKVGKKSPAKLLEVENRGLRRELKKTQSRVENLSYRLGKVAQLLETRRE